MGGRFDAFHSLDADKQQRIIRAALTEFAAKGFKRASTNVIAQQAQVGKGMLFYYFGSKEELFDFLCEYAIEYAKTTYLNGIELDSGDFLKRYLALTQAKCRAMKENAPLIAFYESLIHEENRPYFEKYSAEVSEIRMGVIGQY